MSEPAVEMDIDINIMEVCCACLSKNPSYWLISKTADAFMNITGIELTDDLPNEICGSCNDLLKQSDDFRTKCLESYQKLIEVSRRETKETTKIELHNEIETQNPTYSYDITVKQESVDEEEVIQLPSEIGINTESFCRDSDLGSVKLQHVTVKKKNISKINKSENNDIIPVEVVKLKTEPKKVKKRENIVNTKVKPSITKTNKKVNIESNVPKKISDLEEARSYIIDKSKMKHYKCDLCNFKTLEERLYVTHTKTHKSKTVFICDTCDYRSTQKSNLGKHIKKHTGEKPYKCNICNHRFARKFILDSHLRLHTGEKPYKCKTCNNSFTQHYLLVKHLRTHTGERPYKCETCYLSFKQKHHLDRHLSIHTGEKPYKCKTCNLAFARKHYLDNHTRTHTGEKPYKCKLCDYKSAQKHKLHMHTKKYHYTTLKIQVIPYIKDATEK